MTLTNIKQDAEPVPPEPVPPEPVTKEELRATREYLGCSQERLARVLGRSDSTVRNWETGRAKIPPEMRFTLLGLVYKTGVPLNIINLYQFLKN